MAYRRERPAPHCQELPYALTAFQWMQWPNNNYSFLRTPTLSVNLSRLLNPNHSSSSDMTELDSAFWRKAVAKPTLQAFNSRPPAVISLSRRPPLTATRHRTSLFFRGRGQQDGSRELRHTFATAAQLSHILKGHGVGASGSHRACVVLPARVLLHLVACSQGADNQGL